ncbi:hypothetical protein AVEN_162879-1 [Araneus ventricosus]|uniref:Uncharacterized protein n=1 Tax=Araneus ventricosus TaxID=182803 RepID=A0A4Y2N4N7_ARAVE|nr:hypothetical protein AVEN_162879-1 [Araneus ventricosus]
MEFSRTSKRIFFPNRDIEKRVAFSGIIDLSPRSPNLSPKSGVQARSSLTYLCKTLFPNTRLVRQERDTTFLQHQRCSAISVSSEPFCSRTCSLSYRINSRNLSERSVVTNGNLWKQWHYNLLRDPDKV